MANENITVLNGGIVGNSKQSLIGGIAEKRRNFFSEKEMEEIKPDITDDLPKSLKYLVDNTDRAQKEVAHAKRETEGLDVKIKAGLHEIKEKLTEVEEHLKEKMHLGDRRSSNIDEECAKNSREHKTCYQPIQIGNDWNA